MIPPTAMQTATGPRFYLPELDGLRFIAFLLVFVHNAPSISSSKLWTALHEYGWIGVDLFFCLSAFLITRLLISEHKESGGINIAGFYTRRVLRIWPLYFLFIGIILLSPSLAGRDASNRILQIASLATFTYNFTFIYVFPFAIPAFIHLWTISFEEQFYLAAPWAVRKMAELQAKKAWSILLTAFLAGTIIRAAFIYFQIKYPAIYVLPFTRFESILGGTAIGLGFFDKPERKISSGYFILPGIALLIAIFFLPNVNIPGWTLMLIYLFVGVGMSLVIFSTTQQGNSLLKVLLSNPLLVYLGKISYGLYVFHLIGIRLANQIYDSLPNTNNMEAASHAALVFLISLVITIIVSALSYQFFERPFLKLKERFSPIPSRPI